MITSRFGDVDFSTDGSSGFTIESLDGWYSGPPQRSRVDDRPAADGAFGVSRVYKSARVITQAGLVLSDSADEAMVGDWSRFAAISADGMPSPFTVTDATGEKTCVASLQGTPVLLPLVDGTARYVMTLVAYDPVKYGPTVATQIELPSSGGGFVYPAYEPLGYANYGPLGNLGRAVISNAGTAEVWPVFEFVDEHVVSVDAASGGVLVDGQSDGGSSLLRAEWFPIPAGGSVTVQFGLVDGALEVKCIETGQAIVVARSVGAAPVLTVFSASGWW